ARAFPPRCCEPARHLSPDGFPASTLLPALPGARDQPLLEILQRLAPLVAVSPLPAAVASQVPGRDIVVECPGEQGSQFLDVGPARHPYQHLDPAVEVAMHEVGRPDPGL